MEQIKRELAEDFIIPAPPKLVRQKAYNPIPEAIIKADAIRRGDTIPLPPAMMEADADMVTRYLQYDCNYRACKYRDPLITWGELIDRDYDQFLELMKHHVPVQSNTFIALRSQLKPGHVFAASISVRERDTEEGMRLECKEYLNYVCNHKGRMNGKTWEAIRATDYSYFVWSVGNTMNRDTKTFNVMRNCLTDAHQRYVDATEKGSVQVRKGLVYTESAWKK